jgi:phospholipid/cholesterol/gamma-HCH transport system substrate-binding protein
MRPAQKGRPAIRRRGLALAVAGATLLAGCGMSLEDLGYPGGNVPGPSYRISAEFDNVLNLPAGAQVRVDGAAAGRVERIEAHDFRATVTMRLPLRVALTNAATAELRMTTPLGEGFIEVYRGRGSTLLTDGALLPANRTSTSATVEDMLSAASTLLTGGGLAQLRTVIVELNAAIDDRAGSTRSLLGSLTAFLKVFNDRTGDIDRTLDALDTLSTTLVQRRSTLEGVLTDIAPAAKLLADQTDRFTEVLTRVTKLSRTAGRVVVRTRTNLLATLRDLEPVLDAMMSIEGRVGPTLRDFIRFNQFLDHAVPGDYLTGDVDLANVSAGPRTYPGSTRPPRVAPARGAHVPDLGLRALLKGGPA